MINIRAIGKKKKNGDSKTSSFWGVGFANGNITVNNDEVQGVNIWGQYHDHSGDVNGDMQVDGNITSTGSLSVNSASVQNNLEVGGNISANNATLNGDLTVDDVDATNIDTASITTHDLVVTGNAHFFNLTIDEIKSVGGQIILSAANATVDFVQGTGSFYMLAWNKTDGDKSIENNFKVNDQIICQTFNVADELGDPSNKYYWALVTSCGDATITLEDGDHDMHYIGISRNDYDGDGEPEIGDKICQLGYRGTDDNARQSAIILSAYQSPDPNVTAPSMVQYEGINTFSLDGKAKNIISHGNNTFTGNFRVLSNGTTTNIVDLINGQNPQVITDSEQSWIMADSNGKTYYSTDYQNLPTVIQAYLGSEVIPYSEWITGSQLKYNDRTYKLTGTAPSPTTRTGLGISSITRNTNDVTIGWSYTPNVSYDSTTETTTNSGTTESNKTLEITIVFTHNGQTYNIQKNVPFNMVKASAVTQGADAEFDKLMVDKLDLTVTLDNELTCDVNAKVYHVKGNTVSQLTDLSNYTANLLLSNGTTVALNKSTSFTKSGVINSNYTGMTNPPTSVTLRLYKNNVLVDEATASVKFNAGSIFTITDDAISSAVQQSNTYTDGQITNVNSSISQIQQTANSISTRVTNIENDYVTSSELTQTADNIQLNVYDELKNKTGIDVSQGQITLNGNTVVNGNLTLSESEQGFTLIGDGGYTQILPKSIGTYDEFTSHTTTTIPKQTKANGVETGTDYSEGRIVFTFTSEFNIGSIKSGSVITVAPVSRNYFNVLANGISGINQYTRETSKTIEFIEDGVVQSALSWNNDNQVNYAAQGGNLTIRCTVTAGIYETTFAYSREPWQVIDINVTLPIEEAFTLIGNDGIGMTFGSRKNIYMGADGAIFRYGQYGMMVDDTGVWINESGHWYSLADYIVMYTPHP
jgi:cytoskeletal protein CcmA (bactofilin family)